MFLCLQSEAQRDRQAGKEDILENGTMSVTGSKTVTVECEKAPHLGNLYDDGWLLPVLRVVLDSSLLLQAAYLLRRRRGGQRDCVCVKGDGYMTRRIIVVSYG
jgi:hypothetical protein